MSDRILAQIALQEKNLTLANQSRILTTLAKDAELRQGTLESGIRKLTETTAVTLAVERASVWMANKVALDAPQFRQILNAIAQSSSIHRIYAERIIALLEAVKLENN